MQAMFGKTVLKREIQSVLYINRIRIQVSPGYMVLTTVLSVYSDIYIQTLIHDTECSLILFYIVISACTSDVEVSINFIIISTYAHV